MTGTDRRNAIRLAIAAALAMPLATRVTHARQLSGGLIAPPAGPMRYSRSVVRNLVDGSAFRSTREFSVQFEAVNDGFMLVGRQTAVSVDAPPELARFAELEEARDESALFPIALDAFGRINEVSRGDLGNDQVSQAVELALDTIAQQEIPASERELKRRFVLAFHNAGQRVTASMPLDLFAPAGTPRHTAQEIPLPDGDTGVVETVFSGELDPQTGLMASASREIVTRVEESTRATREDWLLQRA